MPIDFQEEQAPPAGGIDFQPEETPAAAPEVKIKLTPYEQLKLSAPQGMPQMGPFGPTGGQFGEVIAPPVQSVAELKGAAQTGAALANQFVVQPALRLLGPNGPVTALREGVETVVRPATGLVHEAIAPIASETVRRFGIDPTSTPEHIINIPRLQGAGPISGAAAGAVNLVNAATEGLLQPENAVFAATGLGGTGLVSRIAALTLSADQLAGLPEQIRNAYEVVKDPSVPMADKFEAVGSPLVAAGSAGLLAKAGLPEVKAPVTPPLTGRALEVSRGARPPKGPPPEPLQIVSPEQAAAQAKAMQRRATAAIEPPGLPKPSVPSGPGEPPTAPVPPQPAPPAPPEIQTWDDAVAALSARGTGSETRAQVQAMFPQLKLTKETARDLAKAAFGDEWKPGGAAPQAPQPKAAAQPPPVPTLPVPAEGTVRLYHGEGGAGGAGFSKVYWSDNPEYASRYGPNVEYVDVPANVAEAARKSAQAQGIGTPGAHELPDEWVRKAKPVPNPPKAEVHDTDIITRHADAEDFAQKSGWTLKTGQPAAGVKELREEELAKLPPEERSLYEQLLAKLGKQWEFTDRREGSPTKGITFYVKEGSSPDQIRAAYEAKMKEFGHPVPASPSTPTPATPEPEWLGKPLNYWDNIADNLPHGDERARLAKSMGVPNQPQKIANHIRRRVAEIRAKPPTPPKAPEPPVTIDLGGGTSAVINTWDDAASVSYRNESGYVGRLEADRLPNGKMAVENHSLEEDVRGHGYGQKVIEYLASVYGEILSDEHPSEAASKMWERLGAKKQRFEIDEDVQWRYSYKPKPTAEPTAPPATPPSTPPPGTPAAGQPAPPTLETSPTGELIPTEATPRTGAAARAYIIRRLEELEDIDPVTGQAVPKVDLTEAQEKARKALRARLAVIEHQMRAAGPPPAPPVAPVPTAGSAESPMSPTQAEPAKTEAETEHPAGGSIGPGAASPAEFEQRPDPEVVNLPIGSPALARLMRQYQNVFAGIRQLFARRGTKRDMMSLMNAANGLADVAGLRAGKAISARATSPEALRALTFVIQALKMSGEALSADAEERLGQLEFAGDPEGYLRTKQADMETAAQRFAQDGQAVEAHAAKAAAEAMLYARQHFNQLRPAADRFRQITDRQHARLANAGIDVAYENWYVPQRHDLDMFTGADRPIVLGHGGGAGGSTQFKKAKTFEDYASAIEAGFVPRSLSANELLHHYVSTTERLITTKAFFDGLRGVTDPVDGKAVVTNVPRKVIQRADGSIDVQETVPLGYTVHQVTPGVRLAVHNGYSRLIDALTARSQLAQSAAFGTLQDIAAFEKHIGLALDTFHASRVMQTELAMTGKLSVGARQRLGRALVEYSPADLDAAVQAGEITQEMADFIRRPQEMQVNGKTMKLSPANVFMLGLRNGLNVGRFADVIYRQWLRDIPGVGQINRWVFDKQTRAATANGFAAEFERVAAARPDLTANEVARTVARDVNALFGNLQKESIFRNPSLRTILQVVFLAPEWVQGMARREGRAPLQLAQAGVALAKGEPVHMGTAARTMGRGLAAYIVGTQLLNLITRHQLTFYNQERGHKLDAWVPIGKHGFFLSPLSVFGEITHDLVRLAETKPDFASVLTQIGANKLGNIGRAIGIVATGRDPFTGDKIIGTSRRALRAALQLVPTPITISQPLQAAGAALGVARPPQEGAVARQVASSLGFKTEPAPTPGRQIYQLAQSWMRTASPRMQADAQRRLQEDFGPSDYRNLRSALANDDLAGARKAYQALRQQGKTPKQIRQTIQHPHPFTGSAAGERQFKASLSPEDRKLYDQAIQERRKLYQQFQQMLNAQPR